MVKVKNINGTSGRLPSGYTSWLDYWERKSGEKASVCHAYSCSTKTELVGAHVKKAEGSDNSWYIVPLCKGCNKITGDFYVVGPLVAVNPM